MAAPRKKRVDVRIGDAELDPPQISIGEAYDILEKPDPKIEIGPATDIKKAPRVDVSIGKANSLETKTQRGGALWGFAPKKKGKK